MWKGLDKPENLTLSNCCIYLITTSTRQKVQWKLHIHKAKCKEVCINYHTLAIIGGAIDKKIFISLALANRVKIHNKAYGPQHKSTNKN